MSQPVCRIALDIGNSAAKVLIEPVADASGQSVPQLQSASFLFAAQTEGQGDWTDQLCRWVAKCLSPNKTLSPNAALSVSDPVPIRWWVSTVNHRASEQLKRFLADQQGPRSDSCESSLLRKLMSASSFDDCWREISYRDIPLQLHVDRPQRVGIDRLLGAYGAANRFGAPVMVVDAGSAMTLDLVTQGASQHSDSADASDTAGQFAFCGGAILPGLRMQQSALAAGAEALANFGSLALSGEGPSQRGADAGFPSAAAVPALGPARDTRSAIQLGVQAATVGGVTWLWQKYRENLQRATSGPKIPELPIVITGGDGTEISAYLGQCHELVPNLVCFALLDLARSATV